MLDFNDDIIKNVNFKDKHVSFNSGLIYFMLFTQYILLRKY